MSDRNTAPNDDAGFTLIEVLVAFALLSLGLVAVYNAFGVHARSAAEVQFRERTLAEAVTHLESVVAEALPAVGEGKYRTGAMWRSTALPLAIAEQGAVQSRPVRVRIEAFDRRGRPLLELSSIVLVRVAR